MESKRALVTQPKLMERQDLPLQTMIVWMDGWEDYLGRCVRAGELSTTSQTTYIVGVEKFIEWCKSAGSPPVGEDAILEWKAAMLARGRKPSTVNTWLSGLRSLCRWAQKAGRIAFDPTAAVRGEKRSGTSRKHQREALTDAEVRRVLALPDPDTPSGCRDRAMLYLMAYTGARTVEVHRAELGDLRTEQGRLVLDVRGKGRTQADEVIVIADREAESALHDWLAVRGNQPGPLFTSLSARSQGERLSLSAIREMVKSYYAAAGVQGNKTTHSLRHSAITNAVRHGAPIQKTQSMARHANIATTMIYYHEVDRIQNPAEGFIRYDSQADE